MSTGESWKNDGKSQGRTPEPTTYAPYFFYYGHRYCAQAIQMLPEKDRVAERERLMKWVMQVRDKDGMWNDRVFERSRNYGTAMVICILLNDKMPLPPKLELKVK